MSNDNCAFFGEDGISRDVVEMVVGVDNEFNGKFGDHANFAEQGLRGWLVFECINYGDAVVTYHKAGVGA